MSILEKFQKLHTAVTFAEAGEHGTALAIMGREPKPQTSKRSIRDLLNAVTFAEAGEHETALGFIGEKPAWSKSLSFSNLMAAITFAEADCADTAREFMGVKTARKTRTAKALSPGRFCQFGGS